MIARGFWAFLSFPLLFAFHYLGSPSPPDSPTMPSPSFSPYSLCLVLLSSLFFALPDIATAQTTNTTTSPTVTVRNGTYQGSYLPDWDQDAFLGIPFAQPPVGDLRFRWPRSLNESFSDVRSAQEYGTNCYQISNAYSTNYNLGEDCLNLNGRFPVPVGVCTCAGGLCMLR